jgi:hypothetical protein
VISFTSILVVFFILVGFLIAFVIFFNALRLLDSIDFSSYWSSGTKCLTGHSCRLGFGIFKLIPFVLAAAYDIHTIRRFKSTTHVTEFRVFYNLFFKNITIYKY